MDTSSQSELPLYDYVLSPGHMTSPPPLPHARPSPLGHPPPRQMAFWKNSVYETVTSPKSTNRRGHVVHVSLAVVTCVISIATIIIVATNHSCLQGTDNLNEQNNVKNTEFQVSVISDGCCVYQQSRRLQSIFFIEGSPVCLTWGVTSGHFLRGFNIAVFKLPPGGWPQMESCRTFDTWENTVEDERMSGFIGSIPTGRLVLVSIMDDSTRHLSNVSRVALHRFYRASTNINNVAGRDSFALVGFTNGEGECPPPWVKDVRHAYDYALDDGPFLRLEATITSSWTC